MCRHASIEVSVCLGDAVQLGDGGIRKAHAKGDRSGDIPCAGEVSKETFDSAQTQPSVYFFFAVVHTTCEPFTYPMQYSCGFVPTSQVSNLCCVTGRLSLLPL